MFIQSCIILKVRDQWAKNRYSIKERTRSRSTSVSRKTGKMKLLAALVFIVILAEIAVCVKNRYDNYKVYEVKVDNEEQLKVLDKLERLAFSSYDFWKRPSSVGMPVNIMVPPHKAAEFDEIMQSLNFRTSLKISNVQE